MTDSEIDALPAGRKLDALVAWKVMGHVRARQYLVWAHATMADYEEYYDKFPPYSTSIEAAWQVVECGKFFLDIEHLGDWTKPVYFVRLGPTMGAGEGFIVGEAHGDTAPLAICRAALKAVAR